MTDPKSREESRPLLRLRNVTKTFYTTGLRDWLTRRPRNTVRALDDVSLDLFPGQVMALLGPNGAGKTTLVNIVCELVLADAGEVWVDGLPVPGAGCVARQRIGLVTSNERSFFWRLNGEQNLRFFAALHGLPRPEARARCRALMQTFGLEAHAKRPFRAYSAGMKKRLALARGMLHDPAILLMDEPTSALDPTATEDLLALILAEIKPSGRSVLWATHRLEEVPTLCDCVMVLVGGRVRFSGTVDAFMSGAESSHHVTIDLTPPPGREEELATMVRSAGGRVEQTPNGLRVCLSSSDRPVDPSPLLQALLQIGATVHRVEPEGQPLTRIFSKLVAADPAETER